MKNVYPYIFSTVFLLASGVYTASADGILQGDEELFGTPFKGVTELINNFLVPLLLAAAFLMFVYGVFMFFVVGGSDPEKRKDGRSLVIYSIIGFALIFALWGIVSFVVGAIGGDGASTLKVITPKIK